MAYNWSIINEMLTAPDQNAPMLKIDMDPMIHELQPNFATLYSFLRAMNMVMPVDSQEFRWTEDEHIPFVTQFNGTNGDTSDTTLVVDRVDIFNVNDKIRNSATGEVMLITAINTSTKTLTVVRGYGSTTAATITDDDYIMQLHNVNSLGSDTVKAKMTIPRIVSNYVQIFKSTSQIDKSSAKHALELPINERLRQIQKRGIEHVAGIERAFLFGEKKEDTTTFSNGKTAYNTGGVWDFIKTNVVTDSNGTITKTEFFDWLDNYLFADGSDEKLVFVGPIISAALSSWYESKLMLNPDFERLGIKVTSVLTPSGKVAHIKYHELFRLTPELKGTALGLDMNEIKIASYRPNVLNMNIQSPSLDAYLDEWLCEEGLLIGQEKRHAILKGITAYS